MNNYERIMAMTIEQMAIMLANEIPHGDCYGCDLPCYVKKPPYRLGNSGCEESWLEWLEEDSREGEGNG